MNLPHEVDRCAGVDWMTRKLCQEKFECLRFLTHVDERYRGDTEGKVVKVSLPEGKCRRRIQIDATPEMIETAKAKDKLENESQG